MGLLEMDHCAPCPRCDSTRAHWAWGGTGMYGVLRCENCGLTYDPVLSRILAVELVAPPWVIIPGNI